MPQILNGIEIFIFLNSCNNTRPKDTFPEEKPDNQIGDCKQKVQMAVMM
jgi:hypothetical protein